jgi:YfiH family protein
MAPAVTGHLEHDLLAARGAAHGFGLRGTSAPQGTVRPKQVHGTAVARAQAPGEELGPADAVWCDAPGVTVAVVTADCVPILVASRDARVVAAVHAGWRGLADGVIGAALGELAAGGASGDELAAVVGPHIGPCCYEVDEPVLARLRERFGEAALERASQATRAGHARIDLGALVRADLERSLDAAAIGSFAGACTRCDAVRFESYRRNGANAGRMVHWITSRRNARVGP